MSEFDNIFKDKLYQREVPFNPEAWQNAEAMLNAQQGAGATWGVRRWAAVLLFAVASIGAGVWSYCTVEGTTEKQYTLVSYDNASNHSFIPSPITFPKRYTPSQNDDPTARATSAQSVSAEIASDNVNDGQLMKGNGQRVTNGYDNYGSKGTSNVAANNSNRNVPQGIQESQKESSSNAVRNGQFKRNENVGSLFLAPIAIRVPFTLQHSPSNQGEMRSKDNHTDFSNDPAKPSKARFHHHSLSANLGLGGYSSFAHIQEKRYSPGMNMHFGLNYSYAFSEAFAIGVGAAYGFRGGSPMPYRVEDVNYDFGVEKKVSTYQTNQLHRLHIPLTAAYTFAGKHVIEGGVQPSLLLTTKTSVSTFNEGAQGTSEVLESQEWGFVNGHKPMQMAMIFGYQYAMTNNWNIGIRGTLGVTDMTDDQHFGFSHRDLDRQIHLTLRYRFLEF